MTRHALVLTATLTVVISMLSVHDDGVLTTSTANAAEPQTFVGAGDIAGSGTADDATANLLDAIPTGTVFTAGDNAYSDGSTSDFQNHYEPTWGRHKARTRPSPGNHDYHISGAADYFTYFGANAGEPGKGYYSYNLGSWHIISLNSNCKDIGPEIGCTATSPQVQWLVSDLQASSARCTIAYWHHPLFTSPSNHGPTNSIKPFWDALYQYGADVVINGHNHNYERFALQTPAGVRDDTKGIRQFTVGTGGAGVYSFSGAHPNSEARSTNHGVLKLTLRDTSYDWEFISILGSPAFAESGTSNCVGGNLAPAVNAGPDQSIASGATAALDGTVTDDGLPTPPALTTTWSRVSGAGSVTFGDPNAVDTIATFGSNDTYVLRLSASDGEFTTTDDVTIAVGVAPTPSPSPTTTPGTIVTLERRVATGNDDAEERSGSVDLSSSDLELVTDGSSIQTIGIRFTNITIPAGATIVNAWVQFKVDENPTAACSLTIQGQAIDNAPMFTSSSSNVSSRARTTASVGWSPPHWPTVGVSGLDQRTPDLKGVIAEVTGRTGWASGNALVIIITGSGKRVADSYNGDAPGAPLLHIEYASGATPSPRPSSSPTSSPTTSPGPSPSSSSSPTPSSSPSPSPTSTGGLLTLERRVATGNDDAEERSGSVDLSSSDLEMVLDGSSVQTIGIRFTNITVPVGAAIVRAWVQFKVDENPTSACSLTIQGQAVDNAPVFTTSSSNVSSRARTAASVAWSPPHWPTVGVSGPDQRTPDLASVVGQVTGRAGWASGNALVIIITGSGKRVADSYNGDTAGAPLLHIEYTA